MSIPDRHDATALIRDAGGRVAGVVTLHKMAYILKCAGQGCNWHFRNGLNGPFSEDLETAVDEARVFGMVCVSEDRYGRGQMFELPVPVGQLDAAEQLWLPTERGVLALVLANTDVYQLVVIATALERHLSGSGTPWDDAMRLRNTIPSYVMDRSLDRVLDRAMASYAKLRAISPQLPTLELAETGSRMD